jgi:hypothetical protein
MLKSSQVVLLKDVSGMFITLHIRQTQCLQDLAINLLTWLFAAYSYLWLYSRCGISSQSIGLYFIRGNQTMSEDVIGAVMVVGGGIAGMQSALDLADSGYYVHLVEKSPAIGGVMSQLDKTFPTNDCAM